MIKNGYDVNFYGSLVDKINHLYSKGEKNPKIEIHSEKENSEDLLELNNKPNTTVILGDSSETFKQFHRLCISEKLFMCPSGFSVIASYLNMGNVYYKNPSYAHFRFPESSPQNFIPYKNNS